MRATARILFSFFAVVFIFSLFINPVKGAEPLVPICASGAQSTGSFFEIYMPPAPLYNGRFVIWAHGFQDANEPVGIPYDQLCFNGNCIPDLLVGLGFGFATNSYRKVGLAVKEGQEDILDLVNNLLDYSKPPFRNHIACQQLEAIGAEDVYIVGASEGGLITTLLAEENPAETFDAAYALCGPIGDFPLEINYLGNARVTFEYFFPGQVPGYGIFNGIDYDDTDPEKVPEDWDSYFEASILPLLTNPFNLRKTLQWARVAKLPYDPANYFATVLNSAKDVLRYSIINLLDAVDVLGGEPFDNRWKWYSGSYNDFRLNLRVKRLTPDPAAIVEMKTNYNTSGKLGIPLITAHTRSDQQVPYWHETLYNLKTIVRGSFLTHHVNIPVDRYGHCNFTVEEAMGGFALMLLYAGDWEMLAALETFALPE